jgi:DNA-binding transcriptional regulator YdaS (Cro superfamily)
MKLKPFWKTLSPAQRESLAERCDTTVGHLKNVVYGTRPCSESLAISLERESSGEVPCEETCPGADWAFLRGSTATPSTNASRKRA